ncbi:hypothetical protein ACGFNU_33790 [Spirillospora sp. NPDC048911]
MSEDAEMCGDRRHDIGKAVWAFMRMLDEVALGSAGSRWWTN